MKFHIILLCLFSGSVIAQKKSSFQYQILKDNIPFDIENESLTYADSNSILEVLVMNPKLPKSISWEITKMNFIAKIDSKMLFSALRYSDSSSLQLFLGKLAMSSKTMREKRLSHKPGFLIEIQEITGTKGRKTKSVKTGHVIHFKTVEGIE